ncbi:MAG: ATP-binding protein, partial [Clostridia bacterium]|nr:ATP-binding protein [Clostridia bacterium]
WLMGRGKTHEAQSAFSYACVLAGGISLVLSVLTIALSAPIAFLLGARGGAADLLPMARSYLIGVAAGMPFRNIMWVLWSFVPIDNDRGLPIIAASVMAVSNVLLDFLAVSLGGGTFGMGLSTSLSYIFAFLILMTHFLKKNAFLKFALKKGTSTERKALLEEGLPSALHQLGRMVKGIFMNHLLAVVASATAIASYSVYGRAESRLLPLAVGIADTVSALSGVLCGEEDRPMIRRLFATSVRASFIFTTLLAVLAFWFAPQFSAWFIKNDPEALRLSVRAVRAYALGLPFHALNLIYQDYLHGIGKYKLAALSGFLTECGFLILVAGVLVGLIGADAVWIAFPITQLLLFVYFAVLIALERRRLGICGDGLLNKVLLLPDSFDVCAENCLDRTVTTIEEVAELSSEVWQFCEEHGCDGRRRYMMSLAVEEMVGNVILHGFTKDNRHHSVDVRVMQKGEDFILRIRDDCIIFDPVNQLKLYAEDDPAHHIGLRMIDKIAKIVRYTSVLRLNNLFIKV